MVEEIPTTPIDIAEIQNCTSCSRGLAASGSPVFYEITLATCVLDTRNIERISGLEKMIGNIPIARVMSPDNTVARKLPATKHFICMDCAVVPVIPISLLEYSDG